MFVGPLFLFLVLPVLADLSPKSTNISDVIVSYKIPCNASVQQLDLGDISISLTDAGAFSYMDSTLSVGTGAQGHPIWNCMELHWLQLIWHDDYRAAYFQRTDYSLPIIDSPRNGWDYMYHDQTHRLNPITDIPNFGWNIDTAPWFYNNVGESANYTIGQSYNITDGPVDPPSPGWTGFRTYLVAVATQTCTPQPPECLNPEKCYCWLASSGP